MQGPTERTRERTKPHIVDRPRTRRPVMRGLVKLRHVPRKVAAQVHLPTGMPWLRRYIERSAALRTEGLSPEAARHATFNYRFGVANGVILSLVDALLSPSIVLALFVNRLGGPYVLIGLLPAIASAGWFLPQLVVASRVQGLPRMMHWYHRSAIIRVLCLTTIAVSTLFLASNPPLLLGTFFIMYAVFALAGGMSGIPWLEIVSKVIPPRRRGSFFSQRSFWGSVLALLASGLIAGLLSEQLSGLAFPYNFALIFGISTVLAATGYLCWSLIKEPAAEVAAPRVNLKSLLKRGVEVVRTDHEYRSFAVARILLALATVADPFYAVYAESHLHAPAALVGLYLGALSAASLASNFLWGPLGDRATNRTLLTVTVASVAAVPMSALLIPLLGGILSPNAVSTAFALVFVFAGLAAGSARIVNNNMLLSIAPARERPVYIGFLNTVLGLVMFVPPLGGALVDVLGFQTLFGIALALAGSAMLASTRMSTRPAYEERN